MIKTTILKIGGSAEEPIVVQHTGIFDYLLAMRNIVKMVESTYGKVEYKPQNEKDRAKVIIHSIALGVDVLEIYTKDEPI